MVRSARADLPVLEDLLQPRIGGLLLEDLRVLLQDAGLLVQLFCVLGVAHRDRHVLLPEARVRALSAAHRRWHTRLHRRRDVVDGLLHVGHLRGLAGVVGG